MVEEPWSLGFAEHFGFVEVDRQIEQVRAVGDEPPPSALPAGVDVLTLDQHPQLWASCFDRFGREALADFALFEPLEISAEQWNTSWAGDPMFLALYNGEVIGCGSFEYGDADRGSAEIALAVADGMHGRGVGTLLP